VISKNNKLIGEVKGEKVKEKEKKLVPCWPCAR
jgi:hypothetical protein